MDFKEACAEIMQERKEALLQEFNDKRCFERFADAYPDKKQRLMMFDRFKRAGLIDRSWKRSIGKLKAPMRVVDIAKRDAAYAKRAALRMTRESNCRDN